jgi:hypothetical protein
MPVARMLKLVDSLPFIPWFVEVLGSVAGASVLVVVVIVFLKSVHSLMSFTTPQPVLLTSFTMSKAF